MNGLTASVDLPSLAVQHRPRDAVTLRAAAVELARRGLTARDIASALELGEAAVRQLLAWELAA